MGKYRAVQVYDLNLQNCGSYFLAVFGGALAGRPRLSPHSLIESSAEIVPTAVQISALSGSFGAFYLRRPPALAHH